MRSGSGGDRRAGRCRALRPESGLPLLTWPRGRFQGRPLGPSVCSMCARAQADSFTRSFIHSPLLSAVSFPAAAARPDWEGPGLRGQTRARITVTRWFESAAGAQRAPRRGGPRRGRAAAAPQTRTGRGPGPAQLAAARPTRASRGPGARPSCRSGDRGRAVRGLLGAARLVTDGPGALGRVGTARARAFGRLGAPGVPQHAGATRGHPQGKEQRLLRRPEGDGVAGGSARAQGRGRGRGGLRPPEFPERATVSTDHVPPPSSLPSARAGAAGRAARGLRGNSPPPCPAAGVRRVVAPEAALGVTGAWSRPKFA